MSVQDLSKVAYVTLVMKGDAYVPGALVLGTSLRRTGTKAPLVCMVTHDVSENAQSVLKKVYNEVVVVPYIYTPYFDMFCHKTTKYYGEMSTALLTKLNCLNLTQYDKVCLLDADLLIRRNIDDVLRLKAPAATFHNYWFEDSNLYPHMRTGDTVPCEKIQQALTTQNSFVSQTTVLLVPTGEALFSRCRRYIDKFVQDKGPLGLQHLLKAMCNTIDDLTVCTFFSNELQKDWTYIGQEYTCIQWKDHMADPYVYHYFHTKPWTQEETAYPDLKPWFDEARRICEKYPDAKKFFTFVTSTDTTKHKGARDTKPYSMSYDKDIHTLLVRLQGFPF